MLLTPEAEPFVEKLISAASLWPKTAKLIAELMWKLSVGGSPEHKCEELIDLKMKIKSLTEKSVIETPLKKFFFKYERGENPVEEALISLSVRLKEMEDEKTSTATPDLFSGVL